MTDEADIDIPELTALADGSLPSDRAAELRRRIADDPQLAAAFARQEHAVAALRTTDRETAPPRLAARIRDLDSPAPSRLRAWRVPATAVAAIALALLAVVVFRPGGGQSDFEQLAAIATQPASIAAPTIAPDEPRLLDLELDGVAFPAWQDEFDLAALGSRDDRVSEREVRTVLYAGEGKTVTYSIIDARLELPEGAERLDSGGEVGVWSLPEGGVTWERQGHTCLLSGGGLSNDDLVALALWKGGGAVAF